MKGPYVLIKSDGLDAINACLMSPVMSICTIYGFKCHKVLVLLLNQISTLMLWL